MVKSKEFQLWLRIETGRAAALESSIVILTEHVRVETHIGGRWVETPISQLT
jgi:hypothetical protein